jgi:hypothetical protein
MESRKPRPGWWRKVTATLGVCRSGTDNSRSARLITRPVNMPGCNRSIDNKFGSSAPTSARTAGLPNGQPPKVVTLRDCERCDAA